MNKKILIADDEKSIREFFLILFRKMSQEFNSQFEVTLAEDGQKALDLIQHKSFDMVISDLKMPYLSGLELLSQVKPINKKIIFIMITAFGTTDTAVKAMKMGAYDYITKPFNVEEIKMIILSAFDVKNLEEKNQILKRELIQIRGEIQMIGESPTIKKIIQGIEQISESLATILITGESGTGKEIAARLVHQHSSLKEQAFVAVNCGAIPINLIESELFGHKKGSFTGAIADKKGFFELANNGTLFLDEIGELPLETQPKLLRALQEKTIRMVGDIEDKSINIRLIIATNRNLEQMVKDKQFREDLFYRLNVVRFHLPALRERKEDIPELARHFFKKHSQKQARKMPNLSQALLDILSSYDYPGNVRELENMVERMMILGGKELENPDKLASFLNNISSIDNSSQKNYKMEIPLPDTGIDMEKILGELEKNLLKKALLKTEYNRAEAARLLGLPTTRALKYRLQKYNLNPSNNEN